MEIYRSNIEAPDLLPAFPHAEPFVIGGGLTHHDADFDTHCGYLSPDEAAILYTVAIDFPGLWVEVGSHTGWSGAHIAAPVVPHEFAPLRLVAIEPRFLERHFMRRTLANWDRAGVLPLIAPYLGRSDEYFARIAQLPDDRPCFNGAFIDGDHNPGSPLRDAQMTLPHMQDRCVIGFHDFVGQPVQEAVMWLADHGFEFRAYDTPQMLAFCWRGSWVPPRHLRNEDRDWAALRASHDGFDYGRETR